MELLEIFGWIGALLIGLVLGLIGGGGSILTVPVFVYLLGIDPVLATAYSLFVVGASSLVGAARNAQKGMVDFKTGIIFAVPALSAVYATRKYLVPALPDELFTLQGITITKDMAIMVFFAIIMLLASITMLRKKKNTSTKNLNLKPTYNYPMIVLEGAIVGVITGIVGAGGGFLIIPALVILAKIPMKKAVATSLLIIAIKSLIGFLGDVQNPELTIDWTFLIGFTALSVVGIFGGIYLSKFINEPKLKKSFGWFVLVMGIYIILKETVL